mmetsp:Transcript_51858/g.144747  ORF Transcript_51858/g.144747 Transcript_51858/m.144747 type:complete len:131 (-) Transcript_51858:699-1091(-)
MATRRGSMSSAAPPCPRPHLLLPLSPPTPPITLPPMRTRRCRRGTRASNCNASLVRAAPRLLLGAALANWLRATPLGQSLETRSCITWRRCKLAVRAEMEDAAAEEVVEKDAETDEEEEAAADRADDGTA